MCESGSSLLAVSFDTGELQFFHRNSIKLFSFTF